MEHSLPLVSKTLSAIAFHCDDVLTALSLRATDAKPYRWENALVGSLDLFCSLEGYQAPVYLNLRNEALKPIGFTVTFSDPALAREARNECPPALEMFGDGFTRLLYFTVPSDETFWISMGLTSDNCSAINVQFDVQLPDMDYSDAKLSAESVARLEGDVTLPAYDFTHLKETIVPMIARMRSALPVRVPLKPGEEAGVWCLLPSLDEAHAAKQATNKSKPDPHSEELQSSTPEPITKEELKILHLMATGPKQNAALGKIKAKALTIAASFTSATLEEKYKGLVEQTLTLSKTDASAVDRIIAKRIGVAPSVVSNLRKRVEDGAVKDDKKGKPRLAHDDGDEKITDAVVKALVDEMAKRVRFVTHDGVMKYVLTAEDRGEEDEDGVQKKGVMLETINANDFWSRCADMVIYRMGKGKESRDEWLPNRITDKIRGAAKKPFAPRITRVVKHPIFTKDGHIKLTTGYDKESKLLIDLAGLKLDIDLTKKLTKADSENAMADLVEVFGEFPFAGYSAADAETGRRGSIARMLALLLSPLMRETHNGYAPIFVIDKPTAGTGASLLMEVIHLIWTGEEPGASQWPKDDEPEVRKAITGMLKSAVACIFFENIQNFVGGASLPTLATGMWRDRELGGNTIYESLLECPVVLAANNIKLSYDNARRGFPIRLDANMERPSQGRNFAIKDLKTHVLNNRSKIMTALITMIRWWFQNGAKPLERSDKTPGSFEKFCDVIGGVLEANEVHGLLDGLDDFYAAMADEKATAGAFMQALIDKFGLDKAFASAEAFGVAFKPIPKKEEIDEDRYELVFNGIGISPKIPTYELQKQRLGAVLPGFKDCVHTLIVDGDNLEVKFVEAGKVNGSNRWQFVKVIKTASKA